MATIFPGSASVGQIFDGYEFNGTAWDIVGIDLTADYPEIIDGKISASVIPSTFATTSYVNQQVGNINLSPYLTQSSASTTYITQASASTTYATKTELNNIDLSSASAAAVAAIVDSAPSTLNTLNELAAALGDDANYASTITTALGNKLDTSTASSTYQPLNGALSTLSSTFGNITIQSGIVNFANYGMGMISWSLDTNTYLTEISASTTYAPIVPAVQTGFRNAIINGGMDIWQRGTSITPTNGGYNADRWLTWLDGSGSTRLITQQSFTPGAGEISGYEPKYFLRYNQSVAGSGATYNYLLQKIEDVRTFAGQTISISFWAKTAANTTIPGILIGQAYGSGGSPSSFQYTTVATSVAVTTSWTKFTYTVTVPSLSGKTLGTNPDSSLHIFFSLPINATFTFDVWGVQVEAGSVATPFEQRPIGTELSLCQRYYWRKTAEGAANAGAAFGSGVCTTGTSSFIEFYFPVQMRTIPTMAISSGNLVLTDSVTYNLGSVSIASQIYNSTTTGRITFSHAGTGTAFRPHVLAANTTTSAAWVDASAEL